MWAQRKGPKDSGRPGRELHGEAGKGETWLVVWIKGYLDREENYLLKIFKYFGVICDVSLLFQGLYEILSKIYIVY